MFWVQHGYGKGDKIASLLQARPQPAGAILSPNDEALATLTATGEAIKSQGARVLVDPQTYVYSIPEGTSRLHSDHGIEFTPLDWATIADDVEGHVAKVVELNTRLGTNQIIAPSPLQASFADLWTPIAFQYIKATMAATSLPVFASLVVEDAALADWDGVETWLNKFTTLDIHGVYALFARADTGYPPLWDVDKLANGLRLLHRLAVYNQYEVLWGYSDIVGLLALAVGVDGIASGWYYTLRTFSASKWIPKTGGRQAQPRVFAEGLLCALDANSEGRTIADSPFGALAFYDDTVRSRLIGGNWGVTDSWDQYLRAMVALSHGVIHADGQVAEIAARTVAMRSRLQRALKLYDDIAAAGLVVDRTHRTRLDAMVKALQSFEDHELR